MELQQIFFLFFILKIKIYTLHPFSFQELLRSKDGGYISYLSGLATSIC